MFGFGSLSHLLVVLVFALIVLGPKQLPEVARTLGRLLNDLRRASNMFTDEFRAQMRDEEHQRIIQPTPPPVQETTPQPQQEEAHYQLQLEPQPQEHTVESSTAATTTSTPDSHSSEEKKS